MKTVAPLGLGDDPVVERKAGREASGDHEVAGKQQGEARLRLQRIVEAAARAYGVPIALISTADRRSAPFAVRTGVELEVPHEDMLCLQAIKTPGQATLATDARDDRRFAGNPLVTGPPHVCFYAAVPLLDQAGRAVGALCVIDTEPRAVAPSMFNLIKLGREAERIIAG